MKQKSVILQIFHGERGHFEKMPCRKTKNYFMYLEEEERLYETLKEKIPPEQTEWIDKFVDALEFRILEELDGHYLEGFKLGLLLGMEAVSPDKDDMD